MVRIMRTNDWNHKENVMASLYDKKLSIYHFV